LARYEDHSDLAPLEEESAVVVRLKQGDRAAAGQLFTWYADLLYRQVILPRMPVREAAEDVLKDTFRICLERIETYTPGQVSIFFWLRRIAINRALDVHRRRQTARKAHHEAETVIARTMAPPPPPPDRAPEQRETRQMVQASLAKLNPRYALALKLRVLEEHEREHCAAELGVTLGNFDVILHRACKAFRKVYPP
jgi:RNA polymerase sigma factor (sigma-70 family)